MLCRLFPFVVADLIPHSDEQWDSYLVMLQIADYMFAPEITHDEVSYLAVLIENHHSGFSHLYPSASFLPKMHYLVHAPRLITKYVYCILLVLRC